MAGSDMANIEFRVVHEFADTPERVWAEMIDWKRHEAWIPATRIEIDGGNPQEVGGTFTGYTGYGPVMLVDRMRVSTIEWHSDSRSGVCEVEKLGPVLRGTAGFSVSPFEDGARMEWFERVTVPYLPQVLAPVVAKLSAAGFAFGFRRMAKTLHQQATTSLG